jgi:hypothetical protein
MTTFVLVHGASRSYFGRRPGVGHNVLPGRVGRDEQQKTEGALFVRHVRDIEKLTAVRQRDPCVTDF